MGKGKFITGLFFGIVAGVAAKVLYDNRDEVMEVLTEKYENAREDIDNFVEYASDKASIIGEKVSSFGEEAGKIVSDIVSDYASMAKDQYNELKQSFMNNLSNDEPDEDVFTFKTDDDKNDI